MPQATPELQKEWETDQKAIAYLEERGYKLTREWAWQTTKDLTFTPKDNRAMWYLITEWDFGGLAPKKEE